MARRFVVTALAGLALGAAVFAAGSVVAPAPAEAFGGRYEEGWGPPRHGWRPPPPVFHGYWGRRRWHHQDAYGFRPPPPRYGYGYGHGWR
jgi:hypothetical protein